MAFDLDSFYCVGPNAGLTRNWRYSTTDLSSEVEASNYFVNSRLQLSVGDNITVNYMTGSSFSYQVDYVVLTRTSTSTTISIVGDTISQVAYTTTPGSSLTYDDLVPILTNYGAAGTVMLTLPPAIVGEFFDAGRLTNQPFRLKPYGAEKFTGGDPGGYLELLDYGFVQGVCLVAGQWTIYSSSHANVWRLENGYHGVDKHLGWYNIVSYGADPTGVADSTAAVNAAHVAAANATPKGLVVAPIGRYKLASTATLAASMIGLGGQGYRDYCGRAVFVPTITNGTTALKAVDKQGLYLANFAIDTDQTAATALNCIGLQLGQCAALIQSITKTTATSLTIVTKHLHTFAASDAITIENVTGMVELTGAYTVVTSTVTSKTFTITTVNNAAWGAFTPGTHVGLIRPTDATINDVSRGVQENIYVNGCATGFHLEGWLNKQVGLFADNCALGLDGSYLNSSALDLTVENSGQAVQLLGCNDLHILKLEDEVGNASSGVTPSTIDYCDNINASIWSTEGTRTVDTPWLAIAGVSACTDIYIPHGTFAATPGAAKSVTLGNVLRWALPQKLDSGYSTTSSTNSRTTYTPTWASSGTQPVTGNGTLTGTYHWDGSAVTVTITLVKQSTTTLGTGTYTFSLPFTAKYKTVGSAYLFISGVAHYTGVALVAAGEATVSVYVNNDQFGAAAPAMATNGDNMLVSITYAL